MDERSVTQSMLARAEREQASEADVRVEIHDASRLEWSVAVPLAQGEPVHASVELDLEVPENTYVAHDLWTQLQIYTRLDSPVEPLRSDELDSIDAIRRAVLGVLGRLSRAKSGFKRQCRLAASVGPGRFPEGVASTLSTWLSAAETLVADARASLAEGEDTESKQLKKERKLADEYLSVRFLQLMTSLLRSLELVDARAKEGSREARVAVRETTERLTEALENELEYRRSRGFLKVDESSPLSLERYLERASLLKKHFQEVLFLTGSSYAVTDRVRHFVAVLVAIVASTWAFSWQIAMLRRGATLDSTVGTGIIQLALIVGVVYAVKDRIKEVGRAWIAERLHRIYAQRVSTFRLPEKRSPKQPMVFRARESISTSVQSTADPLNAESGARRASVVVSYRQKGTIYPLEELKGLDVQRIKQVFRYDMSPLFARLDDAIKPVPVVDGEDGMRIVHAPRCYRVPARLAVTVGGITKRVRGTIVLHKGGLDRFEKKGGKRVSRRSAVALVPVPISTVKLV